MLSADTRKRIENHITNLASPNEAAALRAEHLLIRFGKKAVEPVLAAARDPDPQVRFRAVWILGKSRDVQVLPVILDMVNDADNRVRYDATLALGELGYAEAVPTLTRIAALPPENDSACQSDAALMALAKLKVQQGDAAEVQ